MITESVQPARSVRQIFEEAVLWSRANFGDQPSYRPLLGIVEEVGELCHAHLKGEQGIRLTPEQVAEKKVDAVADIMIYLFDYCGREGIDPIDALMDTWAKVVQKRNWKANPVDGVNPSH